MATRKATTRLARSTLVAINAKTSLSRSRPALSRATRAIAGSGPNSARFITSLSRPQIADSVLAEQKKNDVVSIKLSLSNPFITRKFHSSSPSYYSATTSSQVCQKKILGFLIFELKMAEDL